MSKVRTEVGAEREAGREPKPGAELAAWKLGECREGGPSLPWSGVLWSAAAGLGTAQGGSLNKTPPSQAPFQS